jgi:hypothetical protein
VANPRWALVLLVGVTAAACQVLVEEMPERGSVSIDPVAPGPVEVVPVPMPVPVPVALPQPGPTPEPTPETGQPAGVVQPTPTPLPSGGSCTPGTGSGLNCPRTSPMLLGEVDAAIDALAEQRPGLFDFGDMRGDRGWLVLDPVAYHEGVAAVLTSWGLCAIYDGEEIAVKRNNDYSEQYDIHLSTGHVRRGEGSYRATCYPAWF